MSFLRFDAREDRPEKLDELWHEPSKLAMTLNHLVGVNRWLGGTRVVVGHLSRVLPLDRPVRVLDIGTGSADIPRRIVRWARRRDRRLELVAVDRQRQVAAVARERCATVQEIRVVVGDGRTLPFRDGTADVAVASATLHHLGDEEAVAFLRELARVSRGAVVINDLERHPVNYFGARVLASTVWRRSPYAEDGPISVRRSFRVDELLELGRTAGLREARVHRHFPYRISLVGYA